ncbi:MAG TPA: NAD-dependent epimerase/dehydratase family protein [Candidatus Ozemobacteraceae bacterium]|nr:NAD-dependent epimerase/dehydratase family protein [Candidatus Ozemobacteraceae bacterium]
MGVPVLVTGGAGFIGSHVARHLIANGCEVVVLDDCSGGFRENVPEGARFVVGDAGDPDLIETLFRAHAFQQIFHLAAYAAEGLSHFIRRYNYTNNLLVSTTLLNAAVRHKVKTFVFTSSIAVYGRNQLPMTEVLEPRPEDPYGIAKYAVELDLRAAHEMFGLDWIVFRPHNVYGTNQNLGDPYRNVIGIFMNQIMQGKPLTIFGDGSQTRAFSHIDDVAPVIARSIDVPGARNQVFNIGADAPVSVNDLARAVMKAMGREVAIDHLPARNEVIHAFADHGKVRQVFGLTNAPISVEDGLHEMADWAWKAGPRQGKPFTGIEIEDGLPPSWKKLTIR